MRRLNLIFFIFVVVKTFHASSIPIDCEYSIQTNFEELKILEYTCNAKNNLPDDQNILITAVNGIHSESKTNNDVLAITFINLKIFFIPKGLKTIFKKFTSLKIDKTPLKFIQKEDFDEFLDLKALQITNSNLQYIGKNLFIELINIELIDLRGNKIFYINPEIFKNEMDGVLKNLNFLLLTGNSCDFIDDIPMELMSHEEIVIFVSLIDNSPCIVEENIHERYIESLLRPTSNSEDTKELEDKISKLNDDLKKITSNFSTCLSNNEKIQDNLTSLTSKLNSALTENEELQFRLQQCSSSNLTCLYLLKPDGYTCLANKLTITTSKAQRFTWTGTHIAAKNNAHVKILVIRYQSVELMPLDVGKTFSNLIDLSVISSGLKKLKKEDFVSLKKLEKITITGNEITSIEASTFDSLNSLKELTLSDNKLSSLPGKSFEKLRNLNMLDLSNNELAVLRFDLIPSTNSIKYFYAINNKLTNLDVLFVWRLSKADVIDFSGNVCDKKFDKGKIDDSKGFFNLILAECS